MTVTLSVVFPSSQQRSSTDRCGAPKSDSFLPTQERIPCLRELVRGRAPETGGIRQFLLPRWKRWAPRILPVGSFSAVECSRPRSPEFLLANSGKHLGA